MVALQSRCIVRNGLAQLLADIVHIEMIRNALVTALSDAEMQLEKRLRS